MKRDLEPSLPYLLVEICRLLQSSSQSTARVLQLRTETRALLCLVPKRLRTFVGVFCHLKTKIFKSPKVYKSLKDEMQELA